MKKRISLILLSLVLVVGLAACGSDDSGAKKVVKAVDSDITEGKLLLQMAKMLVEQDTDYEFKIYDEMVQVATYDEMKKGSFDIFNTYDGTVLTTLLGLDVKNVPEGMSLYDFVNEKSTNDNKVALLGKIGHNNTYAMALRKDIADKYKVKTTTELAEFAPEIVFGAEHGFFSEEGSAKYTPYTEFYGLQFKDAKAFDINLKYTSLDNKEIDATIAYTTDGMVKKSDLVILEDDRNYFPEYNGCFGYRVGLFEEFGDDLKQSLEKLNGLFDNEKMMNLTYQVDVEGKEIPAVAKQFLQDEGLLK